MKLKKLSVKSFRKFEGIYVNLSNKNKFFASFKIFLEW